MLFGECLELEELLVEVRQELSAALPHENHIFQPEIVLPGVSQLWLQAHHHAFPGRLRVFRAHPLVFVDLD
jgi:hypothetical protein